ncbi:bifunctional folylpolyglutamate synthase/dihydrofolate synthase [Ornithinibacillus sp. L9]|uniref:tetrahydrofolate synthase n=1 Tax=Ornithinibacillus caprae TaxID=2678566 RepID=A0A6N8FGW1_9BACI|nr:Mur ligase family protein [Ornithinibacillus caprae]MUK86969.1 bifunctional folylpolyglutamate synthase/dihydrofolate synthase [Ornithinibacillus caprae]
MFKNMVQVNAFFQSRNKLGIKPGLERIQKLLYLQGNPENKLKAIHVAGTNGKGSTIQYINNALMANDYRVGVFTSPSMDGLEGHILDNNHPISKEVFLELINALYPSINQLDKEGMQPSEFEIITVLAIMYFSSNVDIAIIEAGMGGREDTTNCFIPILSIITNVDKDHTAFLGDTIEQITYHKAGIIKEGAPVVVGEVKDSSFKIIEAEARLKKVPIYCINKDFYYNNLSIKGNLQQFYWNDKTGNNLFINLKMQGEHQVKNSSLAIMALTLMKEKGFRLDVSHAIEAIKTSTVPGRFEVVYNHPMVIIDGAHNTAGIQTFLQTVSVQETGKQKHLIFAGFKDKDLQTMVNQCLPYFDSITLTSFQHPRAASVSEMLSFVNSRKVTVEPHWKSFMHKVTELDEVDYYVTGSLHFITMVRKFFTKKKI